MTDTVRALEELSFRTLPALHEINLDGWRLRWSDGGSRRANSVNPLEASSLPIAEKLLQCESWFATRKAPTIFRLTPLAEPELANVLEKARYTTSSPTLVMTAAMGSLTDGVSFAGNAAVTENDSPSADWLAAIPGIGRDARSLDRLRHQLTTSGGQATFASMMEGAEILAIGMGLDLDGYTTIYNMSTSPALQRRGHGRTILMTLLARGARSGSTRAVLQVTEDNTAAISLYQTVGFSTAYTYCYYAKAPSGRPYAQQQA